MKIAIIIPNWNGTHLLPACLTALERQTQAPEQIIVVDNGSRDGSPELIARDYPEVELIRLKKNYGFAGGVNRGLEAAMAAEAEYIALLNTDAEPEPQWLEALMERFENNSSLAIAAAKQIDYNGLIDSTGEEYSIWGTPFPRGRGEEDHGQYDAPERQEILAASGGASLYRASVFEQIGRFDERFFAYYEDVDISFRARLAGWEVLYEPSAVVRHAIGGTSGQLGDFRLYHMYKNFWFLFIKNMPGVLFWKYGWRVAGVFGFKLLQLLVRFKLVVFLKVLGSVLWHTPGLLGTRWRLQRSRRTDPAALDRLLHHAPPPTQPGLVKIVQKLHLS